MAHAFDRRLRVADLIKHELAKLLIEGSRDPRFAFVSVSSVEISRDYSNAKIFVTVLNDSQITEIISALNRAAGYFRYQLAHQVNLRTTPKLYFCYDESLSRGQKIADLLKPSDSSKE